MLKQKVSTLSGGMKRRVNLAAALLGEPRILVLDEPFAGVDAEHVDGMLAVLSDMAKNGVAQLISGHSPDMILPILNKVIVLAQGEIAFCGSVESFMAASRDGTAAGAMKSILQGKPS